MNKTCGTYFTGGGVGTIGLMAAGFTPLFGVEYDANIAAVYAANIGPHIITGRVQDIDPVTLPYVDLFQTSPVCKEFSVAKTGGVESTEELSQARAICAYIRHHLPRLVVIENVEGYKRSKSYARIIACLNECGYWHDADVLNSADFGVAQTRRRLIVRAVREGFVPQLPPPVRWVGWYEAIADLIPTLPEDKFADWQLKRLPETITHTTLLDGFRQMKRDVTARDIDEPSVTMTTMYRPSHAPKAFLVSEQPSHEGTKASVRVCAEPAQTLVAASMSHAPRAFLIPGDNASNDTVRTAEEPMVVVRTRSTGQCPTRAFVMDGQTSDNGESITVPHGDAPIYTVSASMDHRPARAFIVEGTSSSEEYGMPTRLDSENGFTVKAAIWKSATRAWLSQGKVVRMTPRALARFMSIPDWYELPASNKLACTIIGNGVPSLMMQRIAESLIPAIQECAA